jgi:hypothetical protein
LEFYHALAFPTRLRAIGGGRKGERVVRETETARRTNRGLSCQWKRMSEARCKVAACFFVFNVLLDYQLILSMVLGGCCACVVRRSCPWLI